MYGGAWWAAVHGVARSWTRLSNFTFPFHFPALEKAMAAHSSVLAWRIPGTGEPGGLPSMGSHRVGHHWSDLAAAAALRSSLCSILKNGPCVPKRIMYSFAFRWNALYISVKIIWCNMYTILCFLTDFHSGCSIHWCSPLILSSPINFSFMSLCYILRCFCVITYVFTIISTSWINPFTIM